MENVLKLFPKSVLTPLRLTAAASATDAGIQKKVSGSTMKKLILLNKEIDDILKTISWRICLLIKGVSETIKNETNKQKGGFLGILLGTLGAVKEQLDLRRARLEQTRIFKATSSFK